MLHVSIHAGPLAKVSRFNRLATVDIGYERLAPIADYKACLFVVGEGALPEVVLRGYPRWSSSLWDLAARAIALCLHPDKSDPLEEVPALEPVNKTFAFASAMSAIIEHQPSSRTARRATLATMDLAQHGRARGVYRARFEEDARATHLTDPFLFRPRVLCHAELVLRAALVHLTGQHEQMPTRPALCVPEALLENGIRYVPIHRLTEPARTGFARWLHRYSEPPEKRDGAPLGIAPETLYAKFLQSAV